MRRPTILALATGILVCSCAPLVDKSRIGVPSGKIDGDGVGYPASYFPPKESSGKPLTVKVENKLRLLAAGQNPETVTAGGIEGKFIPEMAGFDFEDDATDEQIKATLQAYDATIVRQLSVPIFKDAKPGITREGEASLPAEIDRVEYPKSFVVKFDLSKASDKDLPELLKNRGFDGEVRFSSSGGARVVRQAMHADENKKRLHLKHATIGFGAYPCSTTTEGTSRTSPSNLSGGFYFHDSYVINGRAGDNINTASSFSVFGNTNGSNSGFGTKVAVIDNDFARQSEGYNADVMGNASTYYPWNFASGTGNIGTYDPATSPSDGHGRKMASTIFAKVNNSRGGAGVASNATPYLFHVGFWFGMLDPWQIQAALDSARLNNCNIANMSFAATWNANFSTLIPFYSAMANANAMNVILVASTGNVTSNSPLYPACWGEVMGVGGHDYNGDIANFGGGSYANPVGADIDANASLGGWTDSGYSPNSGCVVLNYGTSGAAAITSGALALYKTQGKMTNTFSAIQKIRNDAWKNRSDNRYIIDVHYGLFTL